MFFKKLSFIFLILFVLGFSAFSLTIPQSVEPYFVYLNEDGTENTEENLSPDEIIRLSLIFSLCEEGSDTWISAWKTYADLKSYCVQQNVMSMDEMEKGDKILSFMYEKVLSSYNFDQTKMDVMLTSGVYNCVSASLLYLALATEFGLDARVQEVPRHSFVIVYTSDGKRITVETTNPYGFNPGQKRLLERTSNSERYAVIPARTYANRTEISRRRAIGLVASNLDSLFNRTQDFEQAVPLSASAYFFVQQEKQKVESDFQSICSNTAVYAERANRAEEGLDFLEKIFVRYGISNHLSETYESLVHNIAAKNVNSGNFQAANETLEKRRQYLSENEISRLENMIKESVYFSRAQEAAEQNDYLAAAEICSEGLEVLPNSTNLRNFRRVCLQNHGVEVHNQIVPLVNSRRYENALEILNQALSANPENRTLQNDLNRLNRMMNQNR